jgi:hypothetical protein
LRDAHATGQPLGGGPRAATCVVGNWQGPIRFCGMPSVFVSSQGRSALPPPFLAQPLQVALPRVVLHGGIDFRALGAAVGDFGRFASVFLFPCPPRRLPAPPFANSCSALLSIHVPHHFFSLLSASRPPSRTPFLLCVHSCLRHSRADVYCCVSQGRVAGACQTLPTRPSRPSNHAPHHLCDLYLPLLAQPPASPHPLSSAVRLSPVLGPTPRRSLCRGSPSGLHIP